jgi:hypothetical protein
VPAIKWDIDTGFIKCPAINSQDARELVGAVNSIKVNQTFQEGGSFVINEFGNVIVPFANTNKKVCVGKVEGTLVFHNSLDSGYFCLNDDEHLKTGDLWDKPYIGIPYNYNPKEGVYFEKDDGSLIKPVKQDPEFMRKIRSIRGSPRFIVNPYGIALTKLEIEWRNWKPIYIGRIDYDKWFESYCE